MSDLNMIGCVDCSAAMLLRRDVFWCEARGKEVEKDEVCDSLGIALHASHLAHQLNETCRVIRRIESERRSRP